jgi:hypothetical protein
LGVSEKPDGIPEHERDRAVSASRSSNNAVGDWESPTSSTNFQSYKSIYTCPRTPFIRRRRDFYIPKTPSHSKNIPNVNTYMNVFFISYNYKPATSSHPKPGLFGTTTLTLLLTSSWISLFVTSEPDLRHILEFPSPEVRDFAGSRLQTFACSRLRSFIGSSFLKVARPRPRGFAGSRFPKIACSRFRGFADSRFLKIANALPLKNTS